MGHILIVEDDALIRMSLSVVLTMEGHELVRRRTVWPPWNTCATTGPA